MPVIPRQYLVLEQPQLQMSPSNCTHGSAGCSVALDNVGGGMAPLTFLQEIPVDYIKIDGCLTRDMTQNPVNRAMVEAINHVAHAMGIRTVAGHTETEALTQQLDYCGIDYAQGNIFGSPKALTEKACACPSDNLQ